MLDKTQKTNATLALRLAGITPADIAGMISYVAPPRNASSTEPRQALLTQAESTTAWRK